MKKISLFLILIALFSCNKSNNKQYEYAGGSVKLCLENEPFTYVTYEVQDVNAQSVLSQVMQGLVSLDAKSMKIIPQIAKSWKMTEDGLNYTFNLRNDVYFHEHELFSSKSDRLLTAEDIIATFEKICSKTDLGDATNAYDLIFKGQLKGADDFFNKKTKSIVGLKADKNNLTITLNSKDDNFLYKLASIQMAIMSKKLIDKNLLNDVVGTGPFSFNKIESKEINSIILLKNQDYYEQDANGCALPYIDSLVFFVQNRKLEQLDMFENNKVDLILGLPTSRITKMLEGRIEDFNSNPPKLLLFKNPQLVTNYYIFDMSDPRFANPKVRQAFNYAIDRDKIGREILRNQYDELGFHGIVPPIQNDFRGYDFKSVKSNGYSFDPAKAKRLMAEAGYPGGAGFGSITLRFNIGDINSAIADEFAQEIFQTLGVNVNIDGSTFEQLNEDATYGRGDVFRTAWAADYPNPETFLNNFYGKHISKDSTNFSAINQSKYVNPKFDQLFEQAKRSDNIVEKMSLFSKAEIELLKNPPFIPLWYNGDMQIVYSYVRNIHFNSLGTFDFKTVYIKPWTSEEYQKNLGK